jgi:hypothetical protein
MTIHPEAEGWYLDPYGLHEQRWFSAGRPSRLVRDGLVEANDTPPDEPLEGPLVLAPTAASPVDAHDQRRADDKQRGTAYDGGTAWDAAIDAATTWGPLA